MVQVRDLTELKVEDLWREVKGDEEEWWDDFKQETLRVVKRLLESAMEASYLSAFVQGVTVVGIRNFKAIRATDYFFNIAALKRAWGEGLADSIKPLRLSASMKHYRAPPG